jgi:hypothetical protein
MEMTKRLAMVGAAFMVAVWLYLYFSPYQSCMRNLTSADRANADTAAAMCRKTSAG